MAIGAAQIIGVVSIQGANAARSQLLGVGGAADDAGVRLRNLASIGVAGLGIGLVAVGVASVKMAADFQQGVTRLKTGAGDMTDNLARLGQGILQVSTQTGVLTNGTEGLNAAMYLIVSSGQRGSQSLTTLTAAAQGAQIEMANVKDVAQILTTIQTNYGISAHTAAQYMDGLVSAVSHGKITLEDLSTSMSPILPMAHELGIHFSDVAAAMSDMTNQGVPADRAAQALRFTMQSIIQPTTASRKAMLEWGLDSAKVATTMKTSLPDALQMYVDAAKHAGAEGTQPFIDALGKMVGGGTRAGQALWALTQSMGVWRTDIQQVNTAMGDTNKNVEGWATVQGNLNLQLDRAHAAFDAMLIQLGTKLLPVLTPIAGKFADWVASMASLIGHTDFSGLANAVQGVADAAGNAFNALGKIGQLTVNSQSWKDFAVSIGSAKDQLGQFIAESKILVSQTFLGNPSVWNNVKEGIGQVGFALSDMADHAMTLLGVLGNTLTGNMLTVKEAVFQLNGTINTGMLSMKDAQGLLALGYKQVADNVTGATIDVAKYVKTADLSGSTTVTLAQALTLVGKNASGFLTAADYATLLADHIGNVKDATTGVVTDVKAAVNHTGAYMSFAAQQIAAWEQAIKNGSTQTFAQFQAEAQSKVEATLRQVGVSAIETKNKLQQLNAPFNPKVNPAPIVAAGNTADQTRRKLLAMNGPYNPITNNGSTIAAGNTADNTRKRLLAMNGPYNPITNNGSTIVAGNTADNTRRKLLAMNGPYHPIVDSGSVVAAGNTAANTRARLLALNGSSTWNAHVNTFQTTYMATIGGPGSGPGNRRAAGGLITEPVVGVGLRTGQRWSFGENGNEMVVPLAAQTRGMSGTGGGGSNPVIHVNVYLDGAPVAKKLMPHIATAIRQATGAKL